MQVLGYGTGNSQSNKLMSVADNGDKTKGFVDGNLTGDDYVYDANGNMIADKNKSISAIAYNHLNLPAQVTKTNGDYLKYTYDASGRKLTQQVYDVSNQLKKTTDYTGEYFYENDTLKFINHEEGRLVINKPGPMMPTATYSLAGNAQDVSGNGLNGTVYGGATVTNDRNGQLSALLLDGIDDYGQIPDNPAFNFGDKDFTISYWVKKLANSYSWVNCPGVGKWNTGGDPGTNSWGLSVGGQSDNIPGFAIEVGNTLYSVLAVTNLSLNQWYNLTGVKEKNTLKIYVNGILEGTLAIAPSVSTTVNQTTLPVYIGKLPQGLNTNGVFDDLQILTRAATLQEIQEYQYHLKDHLGNVRTTFTTKPSSEANTATLETVNAPSEQSKFLRYDNAKRIFATLFDHTNGTAPGYSERLNGSANEKFGFIFGGGFIILPDLRYHRDLPSSVPTTSGKQDLHSSYFLVDLFHGIQICDP